MKPWPAAVILAAAVLVVCDAYLSESSIKKTQQMLKNVCSKKHQVEESVLHDLKKGVFPEDNDNLKCYFACILKIMQFISPSGVIDKQTINEKMEIIAPPSMISIMSPAIEECTGKDSDNSDICQSSYNFIKCSYRANPQYKYNIGQQGVICYCDNCDNCEEDLKHVGLSTDVMAASIGGGGRLQSNAEPYYIHLFVLFVGPYTETAHKMCLTSTY